MEKRRGSLIVSIMGLCAAAVVLTAVIIGAKSVMSVRLLSESTYNTYENTMDVGYRTEIKSQVQSTMAILQSEYDKYKAGEKTEAEAKYDAKEIIRAMRYRDDGSGYFWIDDTDYTLVMHPILVENEGNNRYELEDQNGVMIIQEIMKVCQSPEKGGFNEFYFTKADGVTVAPKVAYSQMFEPWGWAVSTGNYVDDMNLEKQDMRNSLNKQSKDMLIGINAVFLIAIAISMVVAYLFGARMIAPLKKITRFANSLAEGDLTTRVEVKNKNEIGQTAHALHIAQENMRELLQEITEVSQGVSDVLNKFQDSFGDMTESITQVSTAVDSIAENVSEQAASTDDASADVGVMAEKISTTEREIENLAGNAEEMDEISKQSMATLNQLIKANGKTSESISDMAEQTETTNASVQQIQMAANLINEISDQTSLLALNASIEAARAGEAGRGFAVVADEIGKLASQSADSVEEINHVVEELKRNAEKSVEVMDEIKESVGMQVESLTDTQQIFAKLNEKLDDCVASVHSIDTMTVELEKERGNVTRSLEVLNKLAQDNAAVAEETSAMSTELSRVVNDSNEVVEVLGGKVDVLLGNVNKFTL